MRGAVQTGCYRVTFMGEILSGYLKILFEKMTYTV